MGMRRSTDRILTTHGGNLPRPPDLDALIEQRDSRRAEIETRLPGAVAEVVDRQIKCGVTILNDGEYVKAAEGSDYVGYINARVTGWEDLPADPAMPPKRAGVGERDRRQFPGFYSSGLWRSGSGGPVRPGFANPGPPPEPATERVCTFAVSYTGHDAIAKDVRELKAALDGKDAAGFIAAIGPLSLGAGARNAFYPDEESYMMAVAEVVREEYKAVTDAGLVLQVDEPEFATTWMFHPEWSVEEYRRYLESAVEVINHALEGLPEELIRFHVCWGSGHRPHVNDIPLRHFADLLVQINAIAYSVEAGNVRHAHEWQVWEEVKLPEGKILVPGVVSHATDLVEHPELVASRLINFASVVGRENLQAGTDCGIGSRVGHAEIAWAKLCALGEGAELASQELWKRNGTAHA
jgi:5-methyltetrahydropteroyltriglutamate--homocysteine methyltransferase